MKKIFCQFISLLFTSMLVANAENFNFTSAAGIDSFSQTEYVFQNGSKISELSWKCSAAPCIVAALDVFLKRITFNLSYSTVIPVKNGILKDLDFNNTGISKFSEHSLYIDKKYEFSILTGYNFTVKNISFFPFAKFCYKNQKFSGRDGYYQYPEKGNWTGAEPKTNLKGNVISYESEFFIFGLGLGTIFILNDFSFKIGGTLNPYICGNALDSHYVRQKQFYDSFNGRFGFSLSGEFNYRQVFLRATYNHIPLLKGRTSDSVIGVSDSNFSERADFQSGSSFYSFSLILGYKI